MLDVGCWILDAGYTGCRRKHWLSASKLNQPFLRLVFGISAGKMRKRPVFNSTVRASPCRPPRRQACHWIFLELSIVFDSAGLGTLAKVSLSKKMPTQVGFGGSEIDSRDPGEWELAFGHPTPELAELPGGVFGGVASGGLPGSAISALPNAACGPSGIGTPEVILTTRT